MFGLLFSNCFPSSKECFLLVFPIIFQIHPILLVYKQSLCLLKQFFTMFSTSQQITFCHSLHLSNYSLVIFSEMDLVFTSLVIESESKNEGLQHDDLAKEGVVELQLQKLKIFEEFQRLTVIFWCFLCWMSAKVTIHLAKSTLQFFQTTRKHQLTCILCWRNVCCPFCWHQLSQIHKKLLHFPKLFVEFIGYSQR